MLYSNAHVFTLFINLFAYIISAILGLNMQKMQKHTKKDPGKIPEADHMAVIFM
jgi:hypothetical protein